MNNQQEKILLSATQIRALKKMAHHLKPVVQIGKKGISPALIQEINLALDSHELIKVQVLPPQKPNMAADTEAIVEQCGGTHIATIGNIIILFRQKEEESKFEI